MQRTASLERLSSTSAPTATTALVNDARVEAERALKPTTSARGKDAIDAPDARPHWSLFSRGGSAAAPALPEPEFLATSDAFWDALDDDDVPGVQKTVRGVSMLQRERLFTMPSADVSPDVWGPRLPLCRTVAAGQVAMTEALLQLQADPWRGDPWVGGGAHDFKYPTATPAYWGVIYGQLETLRAIYKRTRCTLEPRRALCQRVHAEVLAWLVKKKKGVTSEQLAPAMVAAIGRNDAAGVRLLAKIGKADVNAVCPASESQTTYCSLLSYAMATDKFDAAAVLVEFGANPTSRKIDAASEGNATEENFPLTMAIRKGQVGLIMQMLQVVRKDLDIQKLIPGAPTPVSDAAYLRAAFEAPNAVETYMALYRGGIKPRQVSEAEGLLAQAKDRELDFLYALIARQRALLLLDGESKCTPEAKRWAKVALDTFADALAENPHYKAPVSTLKHAQAMDLEAVMPTRGLLNIFGRWSARKRDQASAALTVAAANALAPSPFMLQM